MMKQEGGKTSGGAKLRGMLCTPPISTGDAGLPWPAPPLKPPLIQEPKSNNKIYLFKSPQSKSPLIQNLICSDIYLFIVLFSLQMLSLSKK